MLSIDADIRQRIRMLADKIALFSLEVPFADNLIGCGDQLAILFSILKGNSIKDSVASVNSILKRNSDFRKKAVNSYSASKPSRLLEMQICVIQMANTSIVIAQTPIKILRGGSYGRRTLLSVFIFIC